MTWMVLGLVVVVAWLMAAVLLSFGLGALVARNRTSVAAAASDATPARPQITVSAA